ncbi:hypothetical protein QFZ20_002129 [Flavobacterium sp. W4I14]|nr:hypothetical protein [Flavobacterium sp. W4I14]
MKVIIIAVIVSITTIQAMAQPQKDNPKLRQKAMIDSLSVHSATSGKINSKYKHDMKFFNFKSDRQTQLFRLSNGDTVRFMTNDDAKVRKLLSEFQSISAVDFLLKLKNIEGNISFPDHFSTWVKREDIPDLLKLAVIDVPTPSIKQYVAFNYKVSPDRDRSFLKTPMAVNALNLIYSHICQRFPTAGSLTPTYESVKDWYQSGKSREEYKLVLFSPRLKETLPTIVIKDKH